MTLEIYDLGWNKHRHVGAKPVNGTPSPIPHLDNGISVYLQSILFMLYFLIISFYFRFSY
jgi:hypothetical protein